MDNISNKNNVQKKRKKRLKNTRRKVNGEKNLSEISM